MFAPMPSHRAELVLERALADAQILEDISGDGKRLLFADMTSGTPGLSILELEDQPRVSPVLDSEFAEFEAASRRTDASSPIWAPDGSWLSYDEPENDVQYHVDVTVEPALTLSSTRRLFDHQNNMSDPSDIAPSGNRFLVVFFVESAELLMGINVVLNWTDKLEELLPPQ